MIETRKREHSRKPDEQYCLIEACSPGPYLELFARQARPNWTAWGDESNSQSRGIVHKGYEGGAIFPALRPNERMTLDSADAVATQLATMYQSDVTMSVRELAALSGYSIQRIRALLSRAGVELRPRGAAIDSRSPVWFSAPRLFGEPDDEEWARSHDATPHT